MESELVAIEAAACLREKVFEQDRAAAEGEHTHAHDREQIAVEVILCSIGRRISSSAVLTE